MLKILEFKASLSNDGKQHGIAKLSVAEYSELATEIDNFVFEEGSTAWEISTGKTYGLAGGTWYDQNPTPETPDDSEPADNTPADNEPVEEG